VPFNAEELAGSTPRVDGFYRDGTCVDGMLSPYALASSCPRLSATQLQQLSPSALAYLGDAVYELYIRHYFLVPVKKIQAYHQDVVAQVRAETQALQLQALFPYLTPEEVNLVKRGRNAASGKPKRIDAGTYQQATSLETLVGYLYLTDPSRLDYLLTQLCLDDRPQ
jgi:ribonuclease III family protein